MTKLRIAAQVQSPCFLCVAACCKQNGHEFAVLLEEGEQRKFGAFSHWVPISAGDQTVMERVISYRDGRCVFLGGDDRCTIYEDRPNNCRRFQCVGGDPLAGQDRIRRSEFLTRNPAVAAMLKNL